ncbi:hypothetical protein AgCh_032209 [Apium graveolens]
MGHEDEGVYAGHGVWDAVSPKDPKMIVVDDKVDKMALAAIYEVMNIRALGEEVTKSYVGQIDTGGSQLLLTNEEWIEREKEENKREENKLLLTQDKWNRRAYKGHSDTGPQKSRGKEYTRFAWDKSKVHCYNYNAYDHYAVECKKPRRGRKMKEEANMAQFPDDEPVLLMVENKETERGNLLINKEHVKLNLNENNQVESNLWYLDNGASSHMIGEQAKFASLDLRVIGQVKFGDGSIVQIEGKGTINLRCKNGKVRTLKETRKSFPSQSKFSATTPIEMVHGDLCGSITPFTSGENNPKRKIRTFRSDNRGEFTSKEISRTLIEMTRSLIKEMNMPNYLWGEAVRHATYLLNRLPTRVVDGITPYEACIYKTPGGEINESIEDPENSLDAHGETDSDYVTSPHTSSSSQSGETTPNTGSGSETEEQPVKYRSLGDIYDSTEPIDLEDDELYLMGIYEPKNYSQAITNDEWKKAMQVEIYVVERNDTWILTELSKGRKMIDLKWIYKVKCDAGVLGPNCL